MKILLTPKIHPDLDGVSCAYAYQKFLSNSKNDYISVIYGKPHIEAEYVINRFGIKDIHFDKLDNYDKFILCDASDLTGMPNVIRNEDVVEVIDHREFHDSSNKFPNAQITIDLVGAAATLVVEKYIKESSSIDFNSAILLYGAIFSNTLNLKGSVTTQRDMEAISWLENKIIVPESFIEEMFQSKTSSLLKNLKETLVNDSKEFEINDIRFGVSQLEVIDSNDLLENKKEEILQILKELKVKHNLSFNFITIADVGKESNFFITSDKTAQKSLEKALDINFENSIGCHKGLLLRKQIVPKIIKVLK